MGKSQVKLSDHKLTPAKLTKANNPEGLHFKMILFSMLYSIICALKQIIAVITCRQKACALHMLGHAERVVAAVENDKLRLEEDVAPNFQPRCRGLNTAKAS